MPYAFTTPNYTQIDRLKISADLNDDNHFYGLLYTGNTMNRDRDTHRFINGYDFRLTNESIDGVKITGYGKRMNEAGQLPTFFPEAPLIQGGDNITVYHNPLSYDKTAAGVKGEWRPHQSGWPVARGLAFTGGYEYSLISRSFADYEIEQNPDLPPSPVTTFDQPDTLGNTFFFGVSNRWSACFDTFVRYKRLEISDPVFGVRATSGDVNTNLPGQSDLIEFGGTWTPSDNFLVNASVGIDKRRHHSFHDNVNNAFGVVDGVNPRETDFDEDSYPVVVSACYAPTCKWSFNGGYATFSNWVDQLITLGDQYNDGIFDPGNRNYVEPSPYQSRWRYYGQSQVVNLGAAYAYSQRLKVLGGWEYTWSRNAIQTAPSPATALNSTGDRDRPRLDGDPRALGRADGDHAADRRRGLPAPRADHRLRPLHLLRLPRSEPGPHQRHHQRLPGRHLGDVLTPRGWGGSRLPPLVPVVGAAVTAALTATRHLPAFGSAGSATFGSATFNSRHRAATRSTSAWLSFVA